MSHNTTNNFFNRELSWLEFNQRVLDQGVDTSLPLLERLKFLAITASNLDEFFMVRVGSLELLSMNDIQKPDPAGMTADDQLIAINQRTHQMSQDQYRLYAELEEKLTQAGVCRIQPDDLSSEQLKRVEQFINDELLSVISPIAIKDATSFPPLINLTSAVCVRIQTQDDANSTSTSSDQSNSSDRFGIIPLSDALPQFLSLPSEGRYDYMFLEDIVTMAVDRFFFQETILESVPIRITRNADFSISEDFVSNLMEEMEEVLESRRTSHCVRLEISQQPSLEMLAFLSDALKIPEQKIYSFNGPLVLSSMMKIAFVKGFTSLKEESWEPQPSPMVDLSQSIFESILQKDILLVHPYESYDPVVRFIEDAADDPDVLAIKQTLYRTSSNSAVVDALIRAAEHGKSVTAVVELKARFDEGRNIDRAKTMERAGIHVIYGVRRLKTHSKICIVIRKEPQGIRRYIHFGTGNYNESTAKLYSDISLMTCDEDLGADAVNFFNAVTGQSQPQRFHKIAAAPFNLRDKIIEMIEAETRQAKEGHRAFLKAKMNSLVDPEIIEHLYAASQSGVKIDLSIRGICCLKPGIKGLSERIRVSSVIDRYLEHARIFHFHHGGDERVFISSADWMPRNLDRRVELLTPVEDAACKKYLIQTLEISLQDNVKARRLFSDGSYIPVVTSNAEQKNRSQETLYRNAQSKAQDNASAHATVLEPYYPPEKSSS